MPTTRKRGATVAVATLGLLLSGAFSGLLGQQGRRPEEARPPRRTSPRPHRVDEPTETPTPTPSPSATATPAAAPGTPRSGSAQRRPSSRSSTTPRPGPTAGPTCPGHDVLRPVPAVRPALDRRDDRRRAQLHRRRRATPPASRSRSSPTPRTPCAPARCSRPGTTSASAPGLKGRQRQGRLDHRRRRSPTARAGGTSSATPAAAPGHFHEFGVVYHGNRMTLLKMDHAGQDHNYPPGQDPMELASRRHPPRWAEWSTQVSRAAPPPPLDAGRPALRGDRG